MLAGLFLITGCEDKNKDESLIFGTSADYRPFEYYEDGAMVGFEIDLAKAIAEKLGKKAEIKDMSFSAVLTELQNGAIDVAVAALNPTEERRKSYDFTEVYHRSSIALVFRKDNKKLGPKSDLAELKIVAQLGSFPERWVKKNRPAASIESVDNVAQATEFIKAEHADAIVMDTTVAISICADNKEFTYVVLEVSNDDDTGCAMAIKKDSSLKQRIDDVIRGMETSGELNDLKKKWTVVSE
ncbi:MAG: ABC transporter substrate-binding protein [Holosporales bacterium]|nr:ABC transporter substrate-binding protein [Holosporales bacterium]